MIEQQKLGILCRIYAPVGNHETLLAYLVRRLLENGANTSFVNRIADASLSLDSLIADPRQHIQNTAQVEGTLGLKHPALPLPAELYGALRQNSTGIDLNNDTELAALQQSYRQWAHVQHQAGVMGIQEVIAESSQTVMTIRNPAQHQDIVGEVTEATAQQVNLALHDAVAAQASWKQLGKHQRVALLQRTATLMEALMQELMILLCRESGKTYANAITEVREVVDFLRYYAAQMLDLDENVQIEPLGTVLCISPWNFRFAIFSGQVAAALVCGNTVIAKPAEQTPLIAAKAIKILFEAGIPPAVVQLLPGPGETVGAQLSTDERVQGIMFTGSTEVARILQKTLSKRLSPQGKPIPLVAETDGQNAMIVDSSALTEQVVLDVVSSAFDSAGQRCSDLRILGVQQDCANRVIEMLKGAMQQLGVGQPSQMHTDIGPVIDTEAQHNIQLHIDKMKKLGHSVEQLMLDGSEAAMQHGTFIPPTLIQLPNLNDLEREVFGPVLHLVTYAYGELPQLLQQINQKGYGLTMGLHTRIDDTMQMVIAAAEVGNLYINRNMVGAVVGEQPFGGEGLSGTGPKAGGPLYLYRLMQHCNRKKLQQPFATLLQQPQQEQHPAYRDLLHWLAQYFPQYALQVPKKICHGQSFQLPGPTGEHNQYLVLPRHAVLSLAEEEQDQLQQLLAIFAIGSRAVLLSQNTFLLKYQHSMPKSVAARIQVIIELTAGKFDAVLHHGNERQLLQWQENLAKLDGPIIGITHLAPGQTDIPLERLVIERAININTAAAGGNASLMTMGD